MLTFTKIALVGLVLLASKMANAGVKYTNVTMGSSCERITTKEDCEDAARELRLSDTTAWEETNAKWPPGCYVNVKYLYFNKNSSATTKCNSLNMVCICKKSSDKFDEPKQDANDNHEKDKTDEKDKNDEHKKETNDVNEKGKKDEGCCSKVIIDFVKGTKTYGPVVHSPTSDLYWSAVKGGRVFVKEKEDEKSDRYLYMSKTDSSSKKYAMWWENGNWMVGHYDQRYKGRALAFAASYEKCPENINYNWMYYSSWGKTFEEAREAMSVYSKC